MQWRWRCVCVGWYRNDLYGKYLTCTPGPKQIFPLAKTDLFSSVDTVSKPYQSLTYKTIHCKILQFREQCKTLQFKAVISVRTSSCIVDGFISQHTHTCTHTHVHTQTHACTHMHKHTTCIKTKLLWMYKHKLLKTRPTPELHRLSINNLWQHFIWTKVHHILHNRSWSIFPLQTTDRQFSHSSPSARYKCSSALTLRLLCTELTGLRHHLFWSNQLFISSQSRHYPSAGNHTRQLLLGGCLSKIMGGGGGGEGLRHTPSIAFRHLPPNSARFGYTTEGALFISMQLSSDTVSALRKVWVLIWL